VRALVIGAGIGGVATAIALRRVGIDVAVVEQAAALGEVGAGVGLWSSAIRALDRLGVATAFRERACAVREAQVAKWDGSIVSRADVGAICDAIGAQSYVVHRGELHAALVAAARDVPIALGRRCTSIEEDDRGVVACFEDAGEERADLAIGADGLRSIVRASLRGEEPPRYSGETCYRGVAPFVHPEPHVLREIQGPGGLRCCVVALDRERVYWWATRPAPAGEEEAPRERKERLGSLFAGWAHHFPEALAATATDAILRNDLFDRVPIPRWSRRRVTLLGDAAHPTTPNLGQGACMAIEDAVVLARMLASHPRVTDAFAAYERERLARTSSIVRMSWRMGKISSWTSPLAVAVRDAMVKATPAWVMSRVLRDQIGYDVGSLPGA
jgi:2-polyprenyl-6-methoxyphenol hydroxylase-like FAD-dependent oxidoreductase